MIFHLTSLTKKRHACIRFYSVFILATIYVSLDILSLGSQRSTVTVLSREAPLTKVNHSLDNTGKFEKKLDTSTIFHEPKLWRKTPWKLQIIDFFEKHNWETDQIIVEEVRIVIPRRISIREFRSHLLQI